MIPIIPLEKMSSGLDYCEIIGLSFLSNKTKGEYSRMHIQLSDHFTFSKLLRFALPSICMMIVTSIYGVVDGLFVSNLVGSTAFAALNLIYPVLMIFGSLGFMIGTGGSALVSKTLGQGKPDRANSYFSMLIFFTIGMGIAIAVLGFIFIRPIARLLGAEGEILEGCVLYGRVLLVSLTAFMLQNAFQSFMVVEGKPKMGLAVSLSAGVCNMVGDFVLIYVCKLGLFGAAAATALSEFAGGLIPLLYFAFSKRSNLKLRRTKLQFQPILKACTNGSSEMLSSISMSLVNILYNFQLMRMIGADGVIAYGIIMYLSFVFVSSFLGYSIGTAPIVGFHYGAMHPDELKNLLRKSVLIISVAGISMAVLAHVLSGVLAGIFVSYDANLMALTEHAIQIYSLSYLFVGFAIYASNFFTALNNGLLSAVISFLRTLVFEVIMVMLLPLLFGINGIWGAVVVADIFAVIVAAALLWAKRKKYGYL